MKTYFVILMISIFGIGQIAQSGEIPDIAFLASSDKFPCPGSGAALFHAWAETTVTAQASCDAVEQEMADRIMG